MVICSYLSLYFGIQNSWLTTTAQTQDVHDEAVDVRGNLLAGEVLQVVLSNVQEEYIGLVQQCRLHMGIDPVVVRTET